MAMLGTAKGLERKIPQVGFEVAKVTQTNNMFKIRLDLYCFVTKLVLEYTISIC